jgi:RNA polymerase sigma-70 factor (ECF subfamily)
LEPSQLARFEAVVLPHLDAAYTLARYLLRDEHDAEDVAQEACLRALKYFDGFRGSDAADGRAWLLTIVRNTAYTLQRSRVDARVTEFDEARHSDGVEDEHPETELLRTAERDTVRRALELLPLEFREVIILREVQGLSYKEIAGVVGIPVGTVMSRLNRARRRLEQALGPAAQDHD